MRLLDEHDVDQLASVELALAAARETATLVASGDLTTGRLQVQDEVIWSRLLFGILPSADLIGYKQFHRVGQRVHYHVHLFERSTGEPIGIVDGRRITSLRTAATAAIAVAHHRGDRSSKVAVIGSGEEAKEGLRMLAGSLAVESVRVFSPTEANRESFALAASVEHGHAVTAVASAAEALDGADVAYIATSASGPPSLHAADVRAIDVLAAIGSTRPSQRELVGDVIAEAAHVVVDCTDALHESGDVIEAVEQYRFDPSRAVLLGDELRATPQTFDGPLVFKSIGSVEQDLVLAHHLMRAAQEAEAGREIEPVASLRIMR